MICAILFWDTRAKPLIQFLILVNRINQNVFYALNHEGLVIIAKESCVWFKNDSKTNIRI